MKTFLHFSHVNVKQIIKCSDTTGKMIRFPVKDLFSKHEKNLLNNSPKKRFISSALKLHFYQNASRKRVIKSRSLMTSISSIESIVYQLPKDVALSILGN